MVTMQLFLLLLLILLLVSHVAMIAAVAGCHSDRDKDHRSRKNCTAAGFSDVPAGFEPTTQVVLFPNNLFSSLSWSSFQVFTEIYEIDLTGNKVPEVTPSVAPILPSLRVLRLGSNRLTSLPAGSFSACPALTELYLENNAISSLSDGSFSGLIKLEILDLTSNHVQVLPDLMLHPLTAIETIYLESNKIKVMPDDWFSQKEEVPYLYLSANPWACSCSVGYLHRYLDDYDYNIYVRDGSDIKNVVDSVVCDSPERLKGTPVVSLEESDFCPPGTEPSRGDRGDLFITPTLTAYATYETTKSAITNPTTAAPPPTTTTPAAPTTTSMTTTPPTTTPPTTTTTAPPTTTPPTTTPPPTTTTPTTPTTTTPPPTTTTAPPTTTTPPPTTTTAPPTTTPPTTTPPPTTTTPTTTITITTAAPTFSIAPTEEASVELHDFSTRSTFTTSPQGPTLPAPVAVTSTQLPTPATAESIPSWISSGTSGKRRGKVAAAGVFCVWLFAGCLLLSTVAAACAAATLARLVVWYRRVYRPLVRRRGGRDGAMLVTYSRTEQEEATGGGVMALYRSVLFVHREGGDTMATEGGGEERGVYRKTLYRLQSREEEVEGWRDVMEACRVSAADGGRRGRAATKRYSVILREERGEAGGGREELDWVVGGWEVAGGGREELRSSWGEWLTQYLPSMPWGVATPPEDKATQ